MPSSILFVDEAPSRADRVRHELSQTECSIGHCTNIPASIRNVTEEDKVTSVMVVGLDPIDTYPTTVVRRVRNRWPWMSLLLVDGPNSTQVATSTIRAGAENYLSEQRSTVENIGEAIVRTLKSRPSSLNEIPLLHSVGGGKLIGTAESMECVFERVGHASENRDLSVLLSGETATGKTHTAHAIHAQSTRREIPLMKVDCRSLTEEHARTLFLGRDDFSCSRKQPEPSLDIANFRGGTVLLDHVDTAAPVVQNIITHALESRPVFSPARPPEEGGLRFIGTTAPRSPSSPLHSDLYHHLSDLPIPLPPLRQRTEDILPLARHFVQSFSSSTGADDQIFTPSARADLLDYSWPGNVRQLKNAIHCATRIGASFPLDSDALILPEPSAFGDAETAEKEVERSQAPPSPNTSLFPSRKEEATTNEAEQSRKSTEDILSFGSSEDEPIPSLEEVKKRAVKQAYEMYDGDVDRAAVALDIGRSTIYRMLKRHNLRDDS